MHYLIRRVAGGCNPGANHLASVHSIGYAFCYGKPDFTQRVATPEVARETYRQLETELRGSMSTWLAFRSVIAATVVQEDGFYEAP